MTSMQRMICALGFLACVGLGARAGSLPTVNGYSGLMSLPNAATIPSGVGYAAADVSLLRNSATDRQGVAPMRVAYGVAPHMEIGAGYAMHQLISGETNPWTISAKANLPEMNLRFIGETTPSLGALYTSCDTTGLRATQLFWTNDIVTDLGWGCSVTKTLGMNWTSFAQAAGGRSGSALRGFAGVEVVILGPLSIAAEYQTAAGGLDRKPLSSAIVRYNITSNRALQFGYSNADGITGAKDHYLFAGMTIHFGKAANTTE